MNPWNNASRLCSFAFSLLAGCVPPPEADLWVPSDDPGDYDLNSSTSYSVEAGQPIWIVPSKGLPPEVEPMAANNNVDITFHQGRLYLAWRSAPSHFASKEVKIFIVSSADWSGLVSGERDATPTWEHEQTIAMGADLREPRLLSIGDRLLFHWFEAGTLPTSFEPRWVWRIEREGPARWSAPEKILDAAEVPWTIKGPRSGRYYLTSYKGHHYSLGEPDGRIELRFRASDDGVVWGPHRVVYRGGVSEAAFELDERGDLWAVTRNEDGDATGFGSHLCHAPASDLGDWSCSERSDPERYDSPWIFRHAGELYLVGRRDIGGPYDQSLPGMALAERRTKYLMDYSLRPKRTALYRIDRSSKTVRHLLDLPSAGDTAFPSVRRTGAHTFLLANYTSPLSEPNITWLAGQTSTEGTQIYFLSLTFRPSRR